LATESELDLGPAVLLVNGPLGPHLRK